MEFKLFDTHSHVNDPQFDADREAVIADMKERGIGAIVVGTDAEMSLHAVQLAQEHEHLWAAVAQHPADKPEEVFDASLYESLAQNPRVVAIGECGLDYFHEKTEEGRKRQAELFEQHLLLAEKFGKPVMIHCRDAYPDLLAMLDAHPSVKGNIHFFAGDWSTAQEFLKRGFTLSFPGTITFTAQYDDVVKNIPADMYMAETDAPYVAPKAFRGKRNEPKYVEEIVKRIAELRGENFETVAAQTVATATRVWGLT